MRKLSLLPVLLFCSTLLPLSALAQQQSPMERVDARFQAADTNHDGQLSRAEADAGMPAVARHFDQIAGNKGFVTLDDLHAAMAELAQKRQAR